MSDTDQLAHLAEFQAALADYHMSASALKILKDTNFVLLVAPTAAGRNTIIQELLNTGNYYFIVSDTTRQPKLRDGRMEQDGREYFFRSEEEVLADLRDGKYLEAAIVHQHSVYGVSIRELEQAHNLDKIAITDIEIVGTHNVVAAKPDAVCIFVLPPNFEEWQRRIKHRGDLGEEEHRRRMESAVKELTAALEQDYYSFVINETVDDAANRINQIARFNIVDPEEQAAGRQLAEQLLLETKFFLGE